MQTIKGGLSGLRQTFIKNNEDKLMQKCCITGQTDGELSPAIVRVRKPNGQEMTISGMVHKSIRAGKKYRGNIGKVISVTRKNVKMAFITSSNLNTIATCHVG